ncbi:MAG: 5-oxoprolinase [Betaproteobacteria bacterium RIFCSPLOWO2_02_FULL_65_24]|nr:MAG: 5-oxoprolinase [Betaproteobacteria bacterium RIFCSPLOWO2_02_FULL_65_24]
MIALLTHHTREGERVSYILAADTGGTFTDLAAYDRAGGRIVYAKSLTTYDDLVRGVMDCLAKARIDLREVELIKFGTTLIINTFVQRTGAKAALVTTEGFRDTLEVRRGNRTIPFDLKYARDPVLIERDRRFEVRERIGADGSVITPVDMASVERLVELFRRNGIEAVAVSFHNAYANPEHEDRVAAALRERMPDTYLTTGTELSREWYEYERTSTAAANAYVGPTLRDYIDRLDGELKAGGFSRTFYLMASNGGVFSVERSLRQPIMLVESGPVGGCIGAGVYADELGLPRVIAFDMGGTTAKCAVLEDGRFEVKSPYYVGGADHGFPIRGGVLDIAEVGTGGGSIAWLDEQGRLAVGPRSAGSSPGPACYGRGGIDPTITDANLVLGRMEKSSFLGGEMELDLAAAEKAIASIAARLGLEGREGMDEMASGVLALASLSMASAIKRITIERGLDPRELPLVAFGGGGPLHSAILGRELSIPEIIIPPEPGVFSALGMILADARVDETRTLLRALDPDGVEEMARQFQGMEAATASALRRELGEARISFERQAEMRFHGQRHTMRTVIGSASRVEDIREAFQSTYLRRYGFVETDAPLEFVSLVLTARVRMDRPALASLADLARPVTSAKTRRSVYFSECRSRLDTPVYQRSSLPVGFAMNGPALIEEYGSTTVVGPRDRFEIGRLGEIRIRFN